MNAALFIDITLWGSVAVLAFMVWKRGRVVALASAREGAMDFITIVPRIALGVIGSGYIAAIIPPQVITGWLGPDSGWGGVRAGGVGRGGGARGAGGGVFPSAGGGDRRRGDARRSGGRVFHRRGGAEERRRRAAGDRVCDRVGAVCLPAA